MPYLVSLGSHSLELVFSFSQLILQFLLGLLKLSSSSLAGSELLLGIG